MTCAGPPAIGPRWLAFHTVGAGGFLVQMGCLWALADGAGLHYLVAAAVAVEAAILHNYVWHARWTWADRPAAPRGVLARLARFNALHGATALLGLATTALLVEVVHVHHLAAVLLSIATCALVNFVVSDRAVFTASVAAGALLMAGAGPAAAQPGPREEAAFDRLVASVAHGLDEAQRGPRPLRIDRTPQALRADARARLLRGEVVVHAAEADGPAGPVACAGALCHHWAASVLVPGGRVDDVVALMQAYDDYREIYDPAVRRSRLVSRDGDRFTAHLRLFTKRVVTVVLDTEYDVRYTRVAPGRVRVDSRSTRIAEVADAGTPQEREKAPGDDNGFLWRLHTYCLIDGREEGAYVQCESVSLTRRIPRGLGWIVGPFVTRVPKESLEFTLGRLRARLVGADGARHAGEAGSAAPGSAARRHPAYEERVGRGTRVRPGPPRLDRRRAGIRSTKSG